MRFLPLVRACVTDVCDVLLQHCPLASGALGEQRLDLIYRILLRALVVEQRIRHALQIS